MKDMKRLIYTVALVVCSLFLNTAQAQKLLNYPLDTINGEEVYLYHAEQSLGPYRIAKNFNITKEELYRLNPQVKERGESVELGELLYIPTGRAVIATAKPKITPVQGLKDYPTTIINGEEVYVYHAEQSIGPYRIAKNFNITKEELYRLNPQVKERGESVELGELLYIPTGRTGKAINEKMQAKVEETMAPKKVEEPVVAEEPIVEQPTEEPVVMIAEEQAEEQLEEAAAAEPAKPALEILPVTTLAFDTMADGRCIIEYALMLPFESQLPKRRKAAEYYMEFYQGALLALHDLQNDSTLYRLRVYDVEHSDLRVNALCDSNELVHVHGVLGLTDYIQIERMTEWCNTHHVPLLLPFTIDEEISAHPQVLQFNSTERQEAQAICQWIAPRDIHCVTIETKEADMSDAMRILREEMKANEIESVPVALQTLLNDSAFSALSPNKENLIILHSNQYKQARILLPHIERLQNAGYRVRLLSQYSWQKEKINVPQVYTSLFTASAAQEEYNNLWEETYVTEHACEVPRYDLLGYDLMRALVKWTEGYHTTTGLQSYIRWEQVGEGGWQNTEVQVVEK